MQTNFDINESTCESIRSCIRRKNFEWSEPFFLQVIGEPRNKMEVYWAVLALRRYGTKKSIPVLKKLLYFPKQDVKACSILTIAQIAKETETEFYAEALSDPKYSEKGYALWAIFAVADNRAERAVTAYLKKNLSKIRREIISIGTYGMGVDYLLKQSTISLETLDTMKKIVECKEPTSPAEEELFQNVKTRLLAE